MKEIKLTQGKVALVDDDMFDYLNQWKWYAGFCSSTNSYYAVRQSKGINGKQKTISMHRAIMDITDPKMQVDHINHDTLNNCKSNLRVVTNAQNQANAISHKNSASKYKGVSWHRQHNKWFASIGKDYKKKYLGYFETEAEAAAAYNAEAYELFGSFANLNKISI